MATFELSPKSRSKVKSCLLAIDLLGIERTLLLDQYRDSRFRKSDVSKAELFDSVLDGAIANSHAAFLQGVCNLPYHRDARSSIEYGVDLALGWMVEDCLAHELKRQGAKLSLTGHDSEREYLLANEISQDPDLRVAWRGKERRVEVMCDWLDTWRTYNHLDLRDSKFSRLKAEDAILFGIAPLSAQGLVLATRCDSGAFAFNPSIKGYGGKPGYTARGVSDHLVPVEQAVATLLATIAGLASPSR